MKQETATQLGILGGILLLTAMVYWPGLGGPFLFDDYPNLRKTQLESLNWAAIWDASLSNQSGFLRRPVANLTLALNSYFGGDSAATYKIVNLLIHLTGGILAFFLARAVYRIVARDDPNRATVAALIAAAFWLLHPIQVSTVLYVVQRMAQLSAVFAMLAVLAWLKWRSALVGQEVRSVLLWIPLCGLFSLLSVLSKENGALIPLYLLAIEVAVFRFRHDVRNRAVWAAGNGILIALPLILGAGYILLNWPALTSGFAMRPFTLGERLLTEIHVIWHYLRLLFLPSLSEMGLYQDDFSVQRTVGFLTLMLGAGLAGFLAIAIACIKRHSVLALAIFWFFAAHAMESTFLPLELIFEHRNYVALLGPAIAVGWYVPALIRKAGNARQSVAIALVLLAALLPALTALRAQSWSSNLSFLSTHLAYHPESFRVQLGMLQAAINADNFAGANDRIDRIQTLSPDDSGPAMLRVLLGCRSGNISDGVVSEALQKLQIHGPSKRAVLGINTLTGMAIQDNCDAIRPDQVISLIDAALDDQGLRANSRLKGLLLLQRARIHAKFGPVATARKDYLAAYKADSSVLTPLYDLFYLQVAVEQWPNARETLGLIRSEIDADPLGIGRSTYLGLREYYRRKCGSADSCSLED